MAAVDLAFYMLLVSLLAIPIVLFFTARRSARGTRLPPGPWALPVLGHLHHFAGGKLPHVAMRDLARRHGPVMLLRFGEVPVVVASSPAAAREVMRTHDAAFASRPLSPTSRLWFQGAGGVSFAPYGDAWRQLRKICTQELLSAHRVRSFRPVREDELGRLLLAVAAAGTTTVNLTEKLSVYVADSTVRAIIGSRRLKDRDAYLRMLKGLFGIVPGMSLPDLFPSSRLAMLVSRAPARILAYRRDLRRIMDGILQEHEDWRASAGEDDDEEEEDLVDVLLRLQKEMNYEFPLTTENIKSVMLVITH
jgi:cytochrome P450